MHRDEKERESKRNTGRERLKWEREGKEKERRGERKLSSEQEIERINMHVTSL